MHNRIACGPQYKPLCIYIVVQILSHQNNPWGNFDQCQKWINGDKTGFPTTFKSSTSVNLASSINF